MASLQPKTDKLGMRLAAHLLRRATFNFTPARIREFADKTPEEAVTELMTIPPLQEPRGPRGTNGNYWLTGGGSSSDSRGAKVPAIVAWYFNETMQDVSIRHKMSHFLEGIFVNGAFPLRDGHGWAYRRLCQIFALGNIKTFAYKMTLDNQMLAFLDNKLNVKGQPNENYAREFLELFTILKGPQIAEGDYTNYTEQDVVEAARLLTGFADNNTQAVSIDPDTGLTRGKVNYNDHDIGNKQFSHAFQNQIIQGASSAGDMFRELQDFVDMVFNQKETARGYVRKLYIYFVRDNISAQTEQNVIEPLANQLYNNGYELTPILSVLLKSKHFYDEDDNDSGDNIVGAKIKSPLDLLLQSVNLFHANKLNLPIVSNFDNELRTKHIFQHTIEHIGYFQRPLSVEGYPGFFKSPNFSKNWINSSYYVLRNKMERSVRAGHSIGATSRTVPFRIDNMTTYFDTHFEHQEYADIFLHQIFETFLPEMPDTDRADYFRDILLGGLSPVNWMFEWQNYKATGDDSAVNIVLTNLYLAIFKSPEFQIL